MDRWRQLDIVNEERLATKVTIIGLGGIGNPVACDLAKMGVQHLICYDGDMVEEHNLSSTKYRIQDIGITKALATTRMIQAACNDIRTDGAGFFKQGDELSGIVISGLDSKSARKLVWPSIKYNPAIPLYIDGRMTGQIGRVLTINPCTPTNIAWYEKDLEALEDDTVPMPCSNRAIIYNTSMISALICAQVKRFIMNEPYHKEDIFDFVTASYLVQEWK